MIARIALRTAVHPACIDASRATAVRFYAEDHFGRKEKACSPTTISASQKAMLAHILPLRYFTANFLRISYNV
ncbi:hypothetical protein RSAG8_10549, partial [Rhizoctonia solani AG-8 WAC10335]